MTTKLELVGIYILFSWTGSILADNIAAFEALRSAIPQGKVRKHAISFAANGVGIGSNPQDNAKYRNKKA
jgi:hypothetical protein